jgi:sphinganine C4-monooxygenase
MALWYVDHTTKSEVSHLTILVTFHSRHHRLYVPYAYGALYNHPFEGFLLDTLGTGLAYLVSGMTVRQGIWFFAGSSMKTVDDHCGYALPWDPLQHITSNNAGYHDIHHQSWGIKSNFSQPFFTFWDRLLGTMWTGDVSARYERSRTTAQRKLDQELENDKASFSTDNVGAPAAIKMEDSVRSPPISAPLSQRKKALSISSSSAGNLKGLRNKVNESLHGRGGNVLGLERSQ